ncbi:hypothetical protein HMPREF2670_18305 [Pseudomonas sp. HMSC072F09]|nr:hypothetical protein HMPREF2670_18305 [Pseudomonas sp. HMSC072F09]
MMSEQIHLAVVAPLSRQMLLYVFNKFVAVTSHNKLSLWKMITLKNRFPDSATMVMVNSVDGIIKDDYRALNTLGFSQQDRQPKTADMPFTKHVECVHTSSWITPKGNLDFVIPRQGQIKSGEFIGV